jgi:murein DD-endopeptidase MepM/ murein hydrolase activator NlpD
MMANSKKTRSLNKANYTIILASNQPCVKGSKLIVPRWALQACALFSVCFLVFLIGSFYYATQITTKLLKFNQLVAENQNQKVQLLRFSKTTSVLEASLQELNERDYELRTLLGLKPLPSALKTAQLKKTRDYQKVYRSRVPKYKLQTATTNISTSANVLGQQLEIIEASLAKSKKSYTLLGTSIKNLKEDFSYIPSIWPVYGHIVSGYGFRRHPIFGYRHFHTGVDIPSFLGANVKATASGIVHFAGWSSGYGKTIILKHRFGFTTVYGHNHRLLVKKGDKIVKGQLISEIGSTGLSTGPHLHYEIRRYQRSVNPLKFLKTDIFMANRELIRIGKKK